MFLCRSSPKDILTSPQLAVTLGRNEWSCTGVKTQQYTDNQGSHVGSLLGRFLSTFKHVCNSPDFKSNSLLNTLKGRMTLLWKPWRLRGEVV